MSTRAPLRALIEARVGQVGCVSRAGTGDVEVLAVPATSLLRVAAFLRDDRDAAYDLVDITAVDFLNSEGDDANDGVRFVVCLLLASRTHQSRARLEISIAKDTDGNDVGAWPSVSSIWPAALVYEREVIDLLGLVPDGHPHPKRLILPESFAGHPLRLDYRLHKTQPQVPAPPPPSGRVTLKSDGSVDEGAGDDVGAGP